MTLFELALLLTTAGVSGVGFASLCNALLDRIGLDRIGTEARPQPVPVIAQQSRR